MEDNQNLCQDIQDLLSGSLRFGEYFEYFSDSELILEHWQECENCQKSLPHASAQVEYLTNSWLALIRETIERIHQEHDKEKQDLINEGRLREEARRRAFDELHPPKIAGIGEDGREIFEVPLEGLSRSNIHAEDQSLHTEFLELLERKGGAIRGQLQIINDNWGLDYFRLATEGMYYSEYSSRVCGPLIASLSDETRTFVFQAVLAADILNLFDDKFPPRLGCAIHQIVERAAPEYLRAYVKKEGIALSEQSLPSVVDESERQRLASISAEIARYHSEIRDGVDSLKAGQMEQIRLLEKKPYQPHEIEEDIRNFLGKTLFGLLFEETRDFLRKAEFRFRSAPESDEYGTPIELFKRAYECEFRHCISGPLAKALVAKGHSYYRSTDGRIGPLVVAGKFNGPITFGHQLWYLRNNGKVRGILSGLGFAVDEIMKTAAALNEMRKKAVHGVVPCTYEEARHARNMLLGPDSMLKALFPQRQS